MPLREDAPGRRARRRGAPPDLTTEAARVAAVGALRRDFHAASSAHVREYKWRTVEKMLGCWSWPPFPLNVDEVVALGSALKAGHYQTADAYLALYRKEAERRGEVINPQLAVHFRDATRSAMRGIGGAVRAMSLPFERLCELPGENPCRGSLEAPSARATRWSWRLGS